MSSELRAFAVAMTGDNYETVSKGKRSSVSDGPVPSWVEAMRGVYSAVLWLLTITVVLLVVGKIFAAHKVAPSTPGVTSITAAAAATSVASAGNFPAFRGTAPASTAVSPVPASGTSAGSTAASAVPVGEIQEIETSRYNHDYFCTVKRSTQTGPSQASIAFAVVGDWSLGRLQDPLASTLSWDGGFVKAARHQYEVDDVKHEFIEGTLTFDGVPQGKVLRFRFGEGGYSEATLPLVLQQMPQPAPRPQIVQPVQSLPPQPQPVWFP